MIKIKKFDFKYIRIASVAPKLKVADVDFNTDTIISLISELSKKDADIILFPELCISSYSAADLFFQTRLLESSEEAIEKIRMFSENINSLIVVGAPIRSNGRLFNCAVLINSGKILAVIPKTHIINSNEYYEERWFSSESDRKFDFINICGLDVPFGSDIILRVKGFTQCRIGVEICEDLWAVKPPSLDLALFGVNIILNLSASNELIGKSNYRRELVKTQSARTLSAYIYSSCGPNESTTDVVYSGHCMIAENGQLLSETKNYSFESHYIINDIDIELLYNMRLRNSSYGFDKSDNTYRSIDIKFNNNNLKEILREFPKNPFLPNQENRQEVCKEILEMQSTALAKRLAHINCKNVVIGVSGGLDSTLALVVILLAFEKLNYDKSGIHAILLPGYGSSKKTKDNAEKLCKLLEINYEVISIVEATNSHLDLISYDKSQKGIVYENAQARERTKILMNIANKHSGIVVGTGDLSEIALGWSTYNADHMSMYNVNSGIPKTLIKNMILEISSWSSYSIVSEILIDIANTIISPELLPPNDNGEIHNTEEIIGSYEVLDNILYYFIKYSFSPKKIFIIIKKIFKGIYDSDYILFCMRNFYIRFFNNQFKRSCMPDGVKIGSISLSPRGDWRMPSDTSKEIWIDELRQLEEENAK